MSISIPDRVFDYGEVISRAEIVDAAGSNADTFCATGHVFVGIGELRTFLQSLAA